MKNILPLALLGAGAYFLLNKRKKRGSVYVAPVETLSEAEYNKTDAVIDAEKSGLSLPEAIDTAKNVLSKLKDAKIDIFHAGKKTTLRKGLKKVKLTSANKKFFKDLKSKSGKRLSNKQKKASVLAINTITSGKMRFF